MMRLANGLGGYETKVRSQTPSCSGITSPSPPKKPPSAIQVYGLMLIIMGEWIFTYDVRLGVDKNARV